MVVDEIKLRRDDLVVSERRIVDIERRLLLLEDKCEQNVKFVQETRWLTEHSHEIKDLIQKKLWMSHTRKAIAFIGGAMLGALMLWNAIGSVVKEYWIR